jgi:hypothetical protein
MAPCKKGRFASVLQIESIQLVFSRGISKKTILSKIGGNLLHYGRRILHVSSGDLSRDEEVHQ